MMDISALIDKALSAREHSYCPYSGFAVGAALLTEDGRVFCGCNIENSAYSPGVCAERTAIFKAVSEGCRHFKAIAIVGGRAGETPAELCFPCGVCRQVMAEFCGPDGFTIITARSPAEYETFTLRELLPRAFGPGSLNGE